ncbi:hypothetical protein Plim_0781 [Planctopirus limnophila DSM 3776]|uniref:Methylaspartate mutase n=1 Tax=Planctopirus limnophila (strain ATCC 43296 / DSM 3776 / IFAM 1008 / Mu 290) TaxID=521674 RepID=D5SRU2_PLAL2|nr:glutamate mutase L [Planctopirus limnophila]ADG66626.1 hypothetical protein Plim_0781 [Planctopirus limnophila DSM 3776]
MTQATTGPRRLPENPDELEVILATDCGSTTTKALLIEKIDGVYRQTYRGEAPTTVEEPTADVTIGVVNAATEVGELAGRQLVDENGLLIRPARGNVGCDAYISTSSAGGGLQMLVCGVVPTMSAASATRAALGAGAIVLETMTSNDRRKPHDRIQRIRDLRPDMILLAGGTDGGTVRHVAAMAELIAPAKPQPRFGGQYKMPVIYAGNQAAIPVVRDVLGNVAELSFVENVRPVLEREALAGARDAIHDLFLEHVMAHAPGYDKLIEWADTAIMPTPGAVGNILQTIARTRGLNALGVDIGGATTDVFSVFSGTFNRTVSANLGMSYSISNVCAEAGFDAILRWVPYPESEKELRNRVKNKMIRPTTIPQTMEALIFEQAVAREALRLAYVQHKQFATTLAGVQQQRTIGDAFAQSGGQQTIVNNLKLDLIVGSGGVLSHAPRMEQTTMMMIDAFEPEGITVLAKDSIFMMPHLGVLAEIHPQAAMDVFERDCLIMLATCIAPKGPPASGKLLLKYSLEVGSRVVEGELHGHEMQRFDLGPDELARLKLVPAAGYDVGAGPGKPLEREIRGGMVGVVFDGRGRPLALPSNTEDRRALLKTWNQALGVYPGHNH